MHIIEDIAAGVLAALTIVLSIFIGLIGLILSLTVRLIHGIMTVLSKQRGKENDGY